MNVRVAAIIPAYNEERTVAGVIRAIRASRLCQDILVVSDGSTDRTAAIARRAGARVIRCTENNGKGAAIRAGLSATTAPVLFFCDADLIGLTAAHIRSMVLPVVQDAAAMAIGFRGEWHLPELVAKMDPLLALAGQRAVRRAIVEALAPEDLDGFRVETALNEQCLQKNLPVVYVPLPGVKHVTKEMKWGGVQGFCRRLAMMGQVGIRRLSARTRL